jgi:toxin ParE1/3/4
MKLRFTPRALENLDVISEYLRSKKPVGSRHVRAAIYETLRSLILFPRLGRLQKAERVRKIVTRKYSYLIYYTIDADAEEIIILNIKHPA